MSNFKTTQERINFFRATVRKIPKDAPRAYVVGQHPVAPEEIGPWLKASNEEKAALIIMTDMPDARAYVSKMMATLNIIGASARAVITERGPLAIFINSNDEIERTYLAHLFETGEVAEMPYHDAQVMKIGPASMEVAQ